MSLAAIAFLASSLVPAQPTSFERVNLRINTDACNFEPATVRVAMGSNVIPGRARLTYSIGNVSVTTPISRLPL
jgi:hypothetical protein